jgi:hypothetical protein
LTIKIDSSDVVIGSGPTAFAAVSALVASNRHPIVIDFGQNPRSESIRLDKKSILASKGVGSRSKVFEYPNSLVESRDGKHLPLSNARGGLSNVWGAGILVREKSEMKEFASVWTDMQDAYDYLLKLMPHVGVEDQTSSRFPWPSISEKAPQSARFSSAVGKLQKTSSDVLFGWPRIALNNQTNQCTRCGECLNGCPLNLFFNSGVELRLLAAKGLCTFIEGPVITIESRSTHTLIRTSSSVIAAKRVFLAAGPIGTPALLQRSSLAPQEITVKDSAVFYCGFINKIRPNGDEFDFSSSHMVAYSRRSGADDFQLALYESNYEYLSRLGSLLGIPASFLKVPRAFVNRVNAGIGFLDSSLSGTLTIRFENQRSIVTRSEPKNLRKSALKIIVRVAKSTREVGITPIPKFVIVPTVGSGYHSGASMPIDGKHVDISGRLRAAQNVFVVDATSLPEISAGSHTFTAMANAFRIAQSSE